MIVYAAGLSASAGNPLNTPIFGWDSLVTVSNVTATTEDLSHPATYLANPSTALFWQSAELASPPEDEYLTVALVGNADPIDYLGVAVHNFGLSGAMVSVEGTTSFGDSPEIWSELVAPFSPEDDQPILFRWSPQVLDGVRLRIQPGTLAPSAAVLHAGKLLVLERGTHAEHVPIIRGRLANVQTGRSESGHFLGRVIISEGRQTTFALNRLDDEWYTEHFDPFITASKELPFFFGWKPLERPADIGFCSMTNEPQPSYDFQTGTNAVELQMSGVAVS